MSLEGNRDAHLRSYRVASRQQGGVVCPGEVLPTASSVSCCARARWCFFSLSLPFVTGQLARKVPCSGAACWLCAAHGSPGRWSSSNTALLSSCRPTRAVVPAQGLLPFVFPFSAPKSRNCPAVATPSLSDSCLKYRCGPGRTMRCPSVGMALSGKGRAGGAGAAPRARLPGERCKREQK